MLFRSKVFSLKSSLATQLNTSTYSESASIPLKPTPEPTTPRQSPRRSQFLSIVDYTPDGIPDYSRVPNPDVNDGALPVAIKVTPPKMSEIKDQKHSFTIWESDSDKSKSPPQSPTHPANMPVEDMVHFVNGMTSFHEMLALFQQP